MNIDKEIENNVKREDKIKHIIARAKEIIDKRKGESAESIEANLAIDILNLGKELEQYKELYIKSIAKGLNESLESGKKKLEQLQALNEGWKIREKELLEEVETQKNNTHILQNQLDVANAEKIEWKKIAEKLAELLLKGDEVDYICDMILDEHCDIYKTGECTKCIIDWARKEVEKDV